MTHQDAEEALRRGLFTTMWVGFALGFLTGAVALFVVLAIAGPL